MFKETAQKKELHWMYQNATACFLVVLMFSATCDIIVEEPEVVGGKCVGTVMNGTLKHCPGGAQTFVPGWKCPR